MTGAGQEAKALVEAWEAYRAGPRYQDSERGRFNSRVPFEHGWDAARVRFAAPTREALAQTLFEKDEERHPFEPRGLWLYVSEFERRKWYDLADAVLNLLGPTTSVSGSNDA